MKLKVLGVILVFIVSGCAYQAIVPSTSSAYDIEPNKARPRKAYIAISQSIDSLDRNVIPELNCGKHKYSVLAGPALRQSILKMMEAAYKEVIIIDNRVSTKQDGPLFSFSLDEFQPKLQMLPGHWKGATGYASVEIALRTNVTAVDGKEIANVVVRGLGKDSMNGGCGIGAAILANSAYKAIDASLQNFVVRVINTDIVK